MKHLYIAAGLLVTAVIADKAMPSQISSTANYLATLVEDYQIPTQLNSFFQSITLSTVLYYAAAACIIYKLIEFFFFEFRVEKTLQDIEQDNELGGAGNCTISGELRSRRSGPTPPPYPNGWFKILNSWELKKGEVKDVQFLGQHLVAFRGDLDGKAKVIDAYCPHLGANLAVGGKVIDNNIRCPFHGWRFSGEGKCTKIPYNEVTKTKGSSTRTTAATIPEQAHTKSWLVKETNGMIHIYHHADGKDPEYNIIEHQHINSGQYWFHGSSSHDVKAHCQELPENGADIAHLDALHVPFIFQMWPLGKLLQHGWKVNWRPGKDENKYYAYVDLDQSMEFKPTSQKIPGTRVAVDITQVGPGLVNLHFSTVFGKMIVMETVTPIKPLLQRATHVVWAERKVPRFVAKFLLNGLIIQFERDVPIWNNKTFVPKPVVVKNDGPITAFRRWYSKFYSEGSEKYRGAHSLDW